MNNLKKINEEISEEIIDEIIEEIYHYLGYITSQMEIDIDENNIFHQYEAFEWTVGVLKNIDLDLKTIKNRSKDKENIYNMIKSIEHIINANKEYYDK